MLTSTSIIMPKGWLSDWAGSTWRLFDAEGNYVEYRLEPESDAWLDSLGVSWCLHQVCWLVTRKLKCYWLAIHSN
jgi:hypothetical protein